MTSRFFLKAIVLPRPRWLAVFVVSALASLPARAEPKSEVLLGMLPLLFADDSGVRSMTGLDRVLHPARTRAAPVLEADRPWEGARVCIYGSVLRGADGEFRLWYMGRPTRTDDTAIAPSLRNPNQGVTLYATSRDGVTWTKPALGLHSFAGSTANNIVFDLHSPSVLLDPFDPDPARRYKMLGCVKGNYHAGTSADGIHWVADPSPDGVLRNADTITLTQDPRTREFLAFHKRPDPVGRTVWLARSLDFSHWSEPVRVLASDKTDNAWVATPGQRTDIYDMSVYPHATGFLGFPAVFRILAEKEKTDVMKDQSRQDGPIDIQLATSVDGTSWRRSVPRTPIIPRGAPGAFDGGALLGVSSTPVHTATETWIYYTAINTGHGGAMPLKRLTIGRAEWRLHGFVSLDAGPAGGRLETVPLRLTGETLIVNADASRGRLRVALFESDGKPIPGFSFEDCVPLSADATKHAVTWKSSHTLSRDRAVRVLVELTSTRLYSLWSE